MKLAQLNALLDQELASESAHGLRKDGPLIKVRIEFVCKSGQCKSLVGDALIDTGADRTAVDFSGVPEGVEPSGTFWAQGVTSSSIQLPIYPVTLYFEGTDLPPVHIESAAATPHLKPQGLVALIGRDVLQQVNLSYDGPSGEFALVSAAGPSMSVTSPGVPAWAFATLGLSVGLTLWRIFSPPECPPCELKREGELP